MADQTSVSSNNSSQLIDCNVLKEWPFDELLRVNLAALSSRDSDLADVIASEFVPDVVHPSIAIDNTVSFIFRGENETATWLGQCSVPRIAAQAICDQLSIAGGNVLAKGVGTGSEVAFILKKLQSNQALFVWEEHVLLLKLVMQLHDFSSYIESGQLVFSTGDDIVRQLCKFYEIYPGYHPIATVVRRPWVSDQENQLVTSQVTQAMTLVQEDLSVRLRNSGREQSLTGIGAELSKGLSIEKLRITNWPHALVPIDRFNSRDLLEGFSQLGAHASFYSTDCPDNVSAFAIQQRLYNDPYHIIVLVDVLRGQIRSAIPEATICITLLTGTADSCKHSFEEMKGKLGSNDIVCCMYRETYEKLKGDCIDSRRVIYWPLGVNEQVYRPVEVSKEDQSIFGSDVVYVGRRLSTKPEAYQVNLPTHQLLWKAIIAEIQKDPVKSTNHWAKEILQKAQRCGVDVSEEKLVNHFIECIRAVLGPSITGDMYCQAVVDAGFDMRVWSWENPGGLADEGAGFWNESPAAGCVQGGIADDEAINTLYNSGKIFLHFSPTGSPDQYLLNGIAAGAFFLVKSHPRDEQDDGVSFYLKPGQDLITFNNSDDMIRKIRYYLKRSDEREQIAQNAREKLISQHSYVHRSQVLLDTITRHLA